MLILASASPRRRELLALITGDFTVITAQVDEHILPGTPPAQAVEELALRKARAVWASHPGDTVIGADTVVVLDGDILGKPRDGADAAAMLAKLSGRSHQVYTGVSVLSPGASHVFHSMTQVAFLPLSPAFIQAYVRSGEPMDKAGAYGIQGQGALFVKGIQGDYYNVVGLPVSALWQVLSNNFLREKKK